MYAHFKERLSRWLHAIGRRFGFDAHYFARNSFIVTLSHGVGILRGIVTGYLVTLLLPKETYGEYQFVMSVIGTVSVIALSGLPSAIGRAIAQEHEDIPLTFTLRWYTLLLSVGTVLLIGCTMLLPVWGRPGLAPLFIVAGLLFVPQNIAIQVFGGIIKGNARFDTALKVTLWSGLLVAGSVLIMLFTAPSSLLLVALTIGIPALVQLTALRPLIRPYTSMRQSWEILTYAWKLTIATIPVSLSWYIDKLLITALFGLNQLATFSVGILLTEQVKVWNKELLPIAFSRQARGGDSTHRRRHLLKIVGLSTLPTAAGIGIYILLSPYFMPLLFPQYDAHTIIVINAIAALSLIVMPGNLFPQYLEARGMIRELTCCHWVSAGVFVICLLTMIPAWGLVGATIARGLFRVTFIGAAMIAVLRTPIVPQK